MVKVITASKSELLRLQILKSWRPALKLLGESQGEDVQGSLRALHQFLNGNGREYNFKDSALGLRLWMARLSRERGEFLLQGSPSLLQRPHVEMMKALSQLGVDVDSRSDGFTLKSSGWRIPESEVVVDGSQSSQFLSALLLNSWELEAPLRFRLQSGIQISRSYLDLTLNLLRAADMEVLESNGVFTVMPGQKVLSDELRAEMDMSSAFTRAVWCLLENTEVLEIPDFPRENSQPDFGFVNVLEQMGAKIELNRFRLVVDPSHWREPRTRKFDLCQTPDLFPVLCALCAVREGTWSLRGAPQLRWKESDRLLRAADFLTALNREFTLFEDGVEILGRPLDVSDLQREMAFDSGHDHRWVMAAHAARLAGFKIKIGNPSAISKTAPEFLSEVLDRQKPQLTVLIGHRGVGKSSLLCRLSTYLPDAECIDLDKAIENKSQKSVSRIFKENGEAYFRELEKNVFFEVIAQPGLRQRVVALGAGFNLELLQDLPVTPRIVWVRRPTDMQGRIFFDRPDLEFYSDRISVREEKYKEASDLCLELPEGLDFENSWEKSFLSGTPNLSGASLTLLPKFFDNKETLAHFFEERKDWNIDFFEFRDDLIDFEKHRWLAPYISKYRFLYSLRNPNNKEKICDLKSLGFQTDWPLEMGEPVENVFSVSFHGNGAPKNSEHYSIVKFSPEVNSFSQLLEFHRWALQRPGQNIFLPRGGRWYWYRCLMKGKFPLNFVREGDGSSLDQPTLIQWMMTPPRAHNFGAVLGHPVSHSRSPVEHADSGAFFAISVKPEEWDEALACLFELGLRKAAVTSPLKNKIKGCNTLSWQNDRWMTSNTDRPAFEKELQEVRSSRTAVWGGGGTLESLKFALPEAQFYSATKNEPREPYSELQSPDTVVWAAGHSHLINHPPTQWKPNVVFDLSYTENSPARAYALQTGAKYISGLGMFKEQARLQKEFWTS